MMPDLSQTTIVIVVVAILLLVIALIMRRRLRSVSRGAAGVDVSGQTDTIIGGRGNTISGDGSRLNAKGFNAPRLGKDDDPT